MANKEIKKIKFEESSIPVSVIDPLMAHMVNANPEIDIPRFYIAAFTAIANELALAKSKAGKTALVFNDLKGNLILGAIVEYHPSEDKEAPDNWTFEFTFDEEDIKDAKEKVLSTDPQFQSVFRKTLRKMFSVKFGNPQLEFDVIEVLFKALKNWLLENAKEPGVELELEGVFLGSAGVEDGEKVISLVPDGALKKIIKNDGATEVAV